MQNTGAPATSETRTEVVLRRIAHVSIIFMAIITLIFVLKYGQTILAPLTLAIIVGLVLGPIAGRLEAFGLPAWVSGLVGVFLFLIIIGVAIVGFAVPLAEWMDRLPIIWNRLQAELADWEGLIASVSSMQEEIRAIAGQPSRELTVNINETDPVAQVAILAPSLAAQIILFLAGLFFFIATRHEIRGTVVDKFIKENRSVKLRQMLDDIGDKVSSYMLSITGINIGLAAVATFAFWVLDVPSPMLWGLLAGVLNFVIYLGPAVMTLIMFAVGLSTFSDMGSALTPPAVYLFINFLEAQFATPLALGRIMTINPFLVFLTIIFWIWLWGPIGGFVAVPLLVIGKTLLQNIVLITSLDPLEAQPRVVLPDRGDTRR